MMSCFFYVIFLNAFYMNDNNDDLSVLLRFGNCAKISVVCFLLQKWIWHASFISFLSYY